MCWRRTLTDLEATIFFKILLAFFFKQSINFFTTPPKNGSDTRLQNPGWLSLCLFFIILFDDICGLLANQSSTNAAFSQNSAFQTIRSTAEQKRKRSDGSFPNLFTTNLQNKIWHFCGGIIWVWFEWLLYYFSQRRSASQIYKDNIFILVS